VTQGSKHSAQVREYFDDRVVDYDAFYDPPSAWARWFNHRFRKDVYLRRDQALAVARAQGCRTMLDVGCGSGQNSVYFVRHGLERVVGIDISAEMIKLARHLAEAAGVAAQCDFQHLDFLEMPVGPRFGIVVACGVFDYVENADRFLAHMAKFAGRVVYGSFPGWTLIRSPLRKIRYALRGCPTHFYRRRELKELFNGVGFGRLEILRNASGHLAWAVRE
jgi:cyclopropane fatty-acyl-phospholipid synthase-like methyltransferase